MGRIRYGARTDDELRNRELEATSTGAWATVLDAFYETDPDVIAAVLPPPLEPADEPRVRITIARVDMRDLPTFGAGTFAVRCKHEGTVGDYPLVMPMTTEQSVIGGRETFGEPKKLAEVTLARRANDASELLRSADVALSPLGGDEAAQLLACTLDPPGPTHGSHLTGVIHAQRNPQDATPTRTSGGDTAGPARPRRARAARRPRPRRRALAADARDQRLPA